MTKMLMRSTTALVLSGALALGACDKTTGQTVGSLVGAVGGAVLGAQFGKGTGQLLATGIGVAAGYMIGDWLGGMLDPQDAKSVQKTTSVALENQPDGRVVSWSNPDTGAKAEITPRNTRKVAKEVAVQRPKVVASPVGMTIVGADRIVAKGANVRAAPSTSSDVLTSLKAGTLVTAVGSVSNGEWYLVGRGNKAVGYVYHTLLSMPVPTVEPTQVEVAKSEVNDTSEVIEKTVSTSSVKSEVTYNKQEPVVETAEVSSDVIDLDTEFETETLLVQTECRDVSMKISNGTDVKQQNYSACKAPDGVWEIE
ncbi:SH3 domain-containing protein [Thalassospira profundimaris]|uniref:SH3 domain-containing protein n=1 Tax=Thalassospira profundimaris TaxID=502049 RepID=UPI000DEDABE0|nr:SH3 domain-containing protein [Thalassospira profundimaris]